MSCCPCRHRTREASCPPMRGTNMPYSKLLIPISVMASMALSACNRTSADDQNKALAAQRQADETMAKTQREADQKAAEAQRKADEAAAQARDEANKDTSRAQTNANDTIRSANESVLKTRNDLREWA